MLERQTGLSWPQPCNSSAEVTLCTDDSQWPYRVTAPSSGVLGKAVSSVQGHMLLGWVCMSLLEGHMHDE